MTEKQEPRDVETRLRAALHSYADVVDDGPVSRPARSAAPHRSPLRGWRASVLAAAAALAVVGGTWVVLDGANDPSTTAASGSGQAPALDQATRAESAPEQSTDPSAEAMAGAADAAGPSEWLSLPIPAEIGVAYPFDLYTHCGVFGADIGGVWFAAQPPLVEEYGPPAEWGNPYQRGTLTLESADEAVFRDELGHELQLRAAPDAERPPICE